MSTVSALFRSLVGSSISQVYPLAETRAYWQTEKVVEDTRLSLHSLDKTERLAIIRGKNQAILHQQTHWKLLNSLMKEQEDVARKECLPNAEHPVSKYEIELFELFEKSPEKDDLLLAPGPLGELPLHTCFFLGLNETGKRLVEKFYSGDGAISTQYKSDLDAWRSAGVLARAHEFDDFGLYTGETVLHIAILQEDEELIKWLLFDKKASITKRAVGSFFKSTLIRRKEHADEESLTDAVGNVSRFQALMAWIQKRDLSRELIPRVANPFSACDYGEYPLSFAASIGNVEICKLLVVSAKDMTQNEIQKLLAKQQEIWKIIKVREKKFQEDENFPGKLVLNAQDSTGNTALHMATAHGQTAVVDWLIRNGADLEAINAEGLTPFTLAAKFGCVDLFHHILDSHFRSMSWKYGSVMMTKISLEQVDTYRIKSKPLHKEDRWRSALEIIVDHEVQAFAKDDLFNALIREKWDKFARRKFLYHTMLPYIVLVTFFCASVLLRCDELRSKNNNNTAADDNSSNVMKILTDLTKDFDPERNKRNILDFVSLFLQFIIIIMYSPWLIVKGWRQRRLQSKDLNPAGKGRIVLTDVFFKNLFSFLYIGTGFTLLCTGILRVSNLENLELDAWAVTAIFLWCNLLMLIMPFKFFGRIIITTYRMLVGDVVQFLFVYLVITIAFSHAQYVLFQKSEDVGPMGGVGTAFLHYVWLGLDDVQMKDLLEVSRNPTLSLTVHVVYIILVTVLLLNLIIAMMGQTFSRDSEDTHRIWIFPFASLVLRQEKRLMEGELEDARYRCGRAGGAEFTGEQRISEQIFYEINVSEDKEANVEEVRALQYERENSELIREISSLVKESEEGIDYELAASGERTFAALSKCEQRLDKGIDECHHLLHQLFPDHPLPHASQQPVHSVRPEGREHGGIQVWSDNAADVPAMPPVQPEENGGNHWDASRRSSQSSQSSRKHSKQSGQLSPLGGQGGWHSPLGGHGGRQSPKPIHPSPSKKGFPLPASGWRMSSGMSGTFSHGSTHMEPLPENHRRHRESTFPYSAPASPGRGELRHESLDNLAMGHPGEVEGVGARTYSVGKLRPLPPASLRKQRAERGPAFRGLKEEA